MLDGKHDLTVKAQTVVNRHQNWWSNVLMEPLDDLATHSSISLLHGCFGYTHR